MNRRARVLAALATLAAACVTLTACVIPGATADRLPAPDRAPVIAGIAADLLPYYGQQLDWTACEGADEGSYYCTTVTAPLDWSAPDAGELELAVIVRIGDSGESTASLLTNPGGPGASGYDLVADSAVFAVGEKLAEAYDVVGFDPRGVGRSTAVTCLDTDGMDAYLFDIPADPRGSDGWTDELTQRNEEFAAACEAGSHGILPFITTVNAAHDMDLLRAVLGDDELTYLGYSYGTFLGATYAQLFPDRVGRLVLDGAIDPSVSGLEVGTTQAIGFESALRAYMADCLTDRECPFRGTVDDAMADLGTLLASVDRTPLRNDDGRMLGADSLMTGIVAALYSQDSWTYLTQALGQALSGDPEFAFFLADFYYNRSESGYDDNSTEAFRAYNCMDYPAETDAAAEDAADALIAEKAPTIAPYWTGVDACEVWPYPPTGTRGEIAAEGAAPIVVVGTTNDPATPYEWSVSLAEQLASGVLVTREGEGHTGFNKGSDCVDDAVETYLLEGTVPTDGLVCR
ncbi:alpha/beta hydrolase [uncultured Microbacterium sp.]|uniref:TAP domain protein n=1 Tax=uncultured Microbacterium sp. TaxID=191216 RepID=A0A1Y5NTT5_9MICO|nr:alpha/beta hydrolase [uncultured Microbacterium sp.]SBS69822.1 TAP domain protein [uncultured Microbacterium sp.]